MLNALYCYFYSFTLKTPSRDMAHEMAAVAVALFVQSHALTAVFIYGWITGQSLLLNDFGRVVVVGVSVANVACWLFYFVIRSNGKRVTKAFGARIGASKNVAIGGLIAVESLFLPIGVMALRVWWSDLSK
jgi:hypothetical protein